jgi:hypothetical protein
MIIFADDFQIYGPKLSLLSTAAATAEYLSTQTARTTSTVN